MPTLRYHYFAWADPITLRYGSRLGSFFAFSQTSAGYPDRLSQ